MTHTLHFLIYQEATLSSVLFFVIPSFKGQKFYFDIINGMKYLSLFSGIGGFELGITQAYENLSFEKEEERLGKENEKTVRVQKSETNNERDSGLGGSRTKLQQHPDWSTVRQPNCIGYSEIDKYATQIYQQHFRQPKTEEEIKNDLDVIKTIVSENNYDTMEVCYVNTARKETSFIKTTNQPVKTALENINSDGVKKILSKAGLQGENIMLCEDSECSICMGEDVSVVENLKKCSLPSNIKTEMDTLKESNMELAICINSPLKNIDQTDTKSCATTVITLKEDTIYAHIKKTKPHRNLGDITKIKAEDLPEFDLIVGGFPCQSFSIAGKRGGFADTRGTLFFDIARIIKAKQPRLLLLENVKGLLSHDKGDTFRVILATLDELGYNCQWQVLNSKNFGVPQNRERVFIIGHLRGTPRPKVFPFGESGGGDIQSQGETQGEGQRIRSQVASTLAQRDYKGGNNLIQLNNPIHSNDRVYDPEGLSPTLNTMQGGNRQPFIPEGTKIRRLTPKECERLQGFPDGWTEGVSDTQRYKCLGNAVTVNVIRAVFSKIIC